MSDNNPHTVEDLSGNRCTLCDDFVTSKEDGAICFACKAEIDFFVGMHRASSDEPLRLMDDSLR